MIRSRVASIVDSIAIAARWGRRQLLTGLSTLLRRLRQSGLQSTIVVSVLAAGVFALIWIVVAGVRRLEWDWVAKNNPFGWRTAIGMTGVVLLAAGIHAGLLARNPRQRTAGLVLGAAGAMLLSWIALYAFVQPNAADDPTEARNRVAQIAVAIVAGLVVAAGSLIAWQRLELDRTSGITQNFTAAVEQLGATLNGGKPNYEVRLGGIYALERIAKNWVARGDVNDYWAVMEVLAAYLRRNTSTIEPQQQGIGELTYFGLPPMTPDVEAALEVLRRRSGIELEREHGLGLDLRFAKLPRARLSGVNLERSNLESVDLHASDLRDASLVGTQLSGANFYGASLDGANLTEAFLDQTDLGESLEKAVFNRATIWSGRFHDAYLTDASFSGTYAASVDFERAILRGATFQDAILGDIWIDGIRVTNLDQLHDAGITVGNEQPYMHGSSRLNFSGAELYGADFRSAFGLTVDVLLDAVNVDPDLVPDHLREEYLMRQQRSDQRESTETEMGSAEPLGVASLMASARIAAVMAGSHERLDT